MEGEKGRKERVCVTGAGGYIASWLVKLLLSKGYIVHGTVRDPNDEKNSHLKKLEKAQENLQVFKADLLDYNSIASAVAGCEGVFHVASPVPSRKVANPEVELYTPAVTGTLNVLKACSEAKVKRAVVVSSVAAVIMNPSWPKDKPMDEDCWSDTEYCKTTEEWYYLAKTLAESKAVDYGKKHGLDVITICPPLVIGPLLQSTLNTSSLLLIYLVKGHEPFSNGALNEKRRQGLKDVGCGAEKNTCNDSKGAALRTGKGKGNAIEEDGDKANHQYAPPDGFQYGDFSELSSNTRNFGYLY